MKQPPEPEFNLTFELEGHDNATTIVSRAMSLSSARKQASDFLKAYRTIIIWRPLEDGSGTLEQLGVYTKGAHLGS